MITKKIYRLRKGAFYGIHLQNNPMGQNKLISLLSGRGSGYIIDFRKNSNTYKKWIQIELNAEFTNGIFIPHGFGHAFHALVDNIVMSYKIDEYFDTSCSRSISYKDPEICLGININEQLL